MSQHGSAPALAMPPPIGDGGVCLSQRFVLEQELGKGGMGLVWQARHAELGRTVALKLVRPDKLDQPAMLRRFLREAEITGNLEHPGILPVYAAGTGPDGQPSYVMRYISGRDVHDLEQAASDFHRQVAPERADDFAVSRFRTLLNSFVAVCRAVDYAHSRGIIHRDIKPAHVWLGEFGQTLLIDWGLAKRVRSQATISTIGRETATNDGGSSANSSSVDGASFGGANFVGMPAQTPIPGSGLTDPATSPAERETVPWSRAEQPDNSDDTVLGGAMGTLGYMSPEQAAGRHDETGSPSDIYGLGATFYFVLTGRASQPGADWRERTIAGEFPRPRQVLACVPAALEAICVKAMALRPEDRYASAGALAEDVENWLADEPVSAWREPALVRARRWMRRHRTLVTSSAATIAMAVVLLSVSAVLLNASRQREAAAKEEALENLDLTRSAVDELSTTVSESDLLNVPGMQPLRKVLLEKGIPYYEQLAARGPSGAGEPAEAARNHFRLGRVQEALGNGDAALAAYEKARELQQTVSDTAPNDTVALAMLAETLNAMGRVHHQRKNWDAALTMFQQAEQLRAQVVEVAPDDVEGQRVWANSVMNIGEIFASQGNGDGAREQFRRARSIRTTAWEKRPGERLALDLAGGAYNLADVESKQADEINLNNPEEWGRMKREAKRILTEDALYWLDQAEGVNREQPSSECRYQRAQCQLRLGNLGIDLKDNETECVSQLENAVHAFRTLTWENPADSKYRCQWGAALLSLGGAWFNLAEAATLKDPGAADQQEKRFQTAYAHLSEATRVVEPLALVERASSDCLRTLADAHFYCGKILLSKDRPVPGKEHMLNARRFVDQALQRLEGRPSEQESFRSLGKKVDALLNSHEMAEPAGASPFQGD